MIYWSQAFRRVQALWRRTSRRTTASSALALTALEDRLTPIVGAFGLAAPVSPGAGLDGVVYLTDGLTLTATGSLLSTGHHVLTAAHVVDRDGDRQADHGMTIRFDLPDRTVEMNVSADDISIAPGWTGLNANGSVPYTGNDMAILTLPALAPAEADRYDLYRSSNEVGQTFTLVGYGMAGQGSTGLDATQYGVKRSGENRFDASQLVIGVPITPNELGLFADFDNGNSSNDAFGRNMNVFNLGRGNSEAAVAPGDSGGPALIATANSYAVAGVAALYFSGGAADIDGRDNSSFGDYFGYTRVSAFTSFIDSIVNAAQPIIIDLTMQPGTSDGVDDQVIVQANGNNLEIIVNGERIQSIAATNVANLRILSGNDSANLTLKNGVNDQLPYQTEGVADVTDQREPLPPPTSPPTQPPITVPVPTRPSSPNVPPVLSGSGTYAAGGAAGFPTARMYNADGSVRFQVQPYASDFLGGVRVASADVTGDGVPDLIAAPGQGMSPLVRVYDGVSGSEAWSFLAYEAEFFGGVFIAAGDVTGDGIAEIVTSPDQGGGPRVRVFQGQNITVLADFLGIEDPNFRGGARLALGDFNADGFADLVVGAGYGGGPRVAGFSGSALRFGLAQKMFNDFFVFEESLRNGVFLAAGDLDGDGRADLIAGGGPGGAPRVIALQSGVGRQIVNFFAGNVEQRGGIRVFATDLNDDNRVELITGTGEGESASVSVYGNDDLFDANPAPLDVLSLGGGLLGVFVG